MCTDAPYWSKKGGPDGEPACVTSCPARALKLVKETPSQEDVNGYDVNLAPPAPKGGFGGFGGGAPKGGAPKQAPKS